MTLNIEPEETKMERAAARAEGALDGATRVAGEIRRWYGNTVPEALKQRIDRVLGELERASSSQLEALTKQSFPAHTGRRRVIGAP